MKSFLKKEGKRKRSAFFHNVAQVIYDDDHPALEARQEIPKSNNGKRRGGGNIFQSRGLTSAFRFTYLQQCPSRRFISARVLKWDEAASQLKNEEK
jgi:hypothetical protein